MKKIKTQELQKPAVEIIKHNPSDVMPHLISLNERSKTVAPYFMGEVDYNNFTYLHQDYTSVFTLAYLRSKMGRLDDEKTTPKAWQDAICLAFIDQKMLPKSKILEIGGGNSRVLETFKNKHECWNLDKFEGVGNGPKSIPKVDYKIVQDFIGNFNADLPNNYFDLIFSISVLEHTPRDEKTLKNILNDINRLLKPGGYVVHCIDFGIKALDNNEARYMHPIIQYFFNNVKTLNNFIPPEKAVSSAGFRSMTKKVYDAAWFPINKIPYERSGRPTSIQIFWQKPYIMQESIDNKQEAVHDLQQQVNSLQQKVNNIEQQLRLSTIVNSSSTTLKNIALQPFLKKKAFALCNTNQLLEAENIAQSIIVNNPYMAWAYYIIGRVQRKRGELELALENYQKSINLEPSTIYFVKEYEACLTEWKKRSKI